MPRPRLLVLAAVALLAALSGCGADEPLRTTSSSIKLSLDEYSITPQAVHVRRQRLKFTARNTGKLPHNLVIERPSDDPEELPVEIARIITLKAGETGIVKVDPVKLPVGEYRIVCTVGNHDDLGQYGELFVED